MPGLGGWKAGAADGPIAIAAPSPGRPRYLAAATGEGPVVSIEVAYPTRADNDRKTAARLVVADMLSRRVVRVREELGAGYDARARYAPRSRPNLFLMRSDVDPAAR
jgi:hypothetical protein